MIKKIWHQKSFRWTLLAIGVLGGLNLYFVQQMIAAFLIFSALFACLAGILLVVFLIDYVGQASLGWAEAIFRKSLSVMHRGEVGVAPNQLQWASSRVSTETPARLNVRS
jgi:hypothetical protein